MKLSDIGVAQAWWIGCRSTSGEYEGAYLVYERHSHSLIPRYISGSTLRWMIDVESKRRGYNFLKLRGMFPSSKVIVGADFRGMVPLAMGTFLSYSHEDYDRWRVNMITFLDKVETGFPTRALVYLQDKDIWITKKIRGADEGDYAYNFDKAGWEQVDDLS